MIMNSFASAFVRVEAFRDRRLFNGSSQRNYKPNICVILIDVQRHLTRVAVDRPIVAYLETKRIPLLATHRVPTIRQRNRENNLLDGH